MSGFKEKLHVRKEYELPFALSLEEDGCYLDLGVDAGDLGIEGNKDKTIEIQVFIRRFNCNEGIFSIGTTGHEFGEFSLRVVGGMLNRFRAQFWGRDTDFSCVAKNKWVHFALTHDGEIQKIYADGELVGEQIHELDTSTEENLRVGWWQSAEEGTLDGLVKDLRVWNTARTEDQIRDGMGAALSGEEDGLVGYWPMDEHEGNTVHDRSGNENHAEIAGAGWRIVKHEVLAEAPCLALPALIEVTEKHPIVEVRRQAVEIMGELNLAFEEIESVLLEILDDTEKENIIRQEAVRSIKNAAGEDAAPALISRYRRDAGTAIRKELLEALGELADDGKLDPHADIAGPMLKDLLKDSHAPATDRLEAAKIIAVSGPALQEKVEDYEAALPEVLPQIVRDANVDAASRVEAFEEVAGGCLEEWTRLTDDFRPPYDYPEKFNDATSTHNRPPYNPQPLMSDAEFFGDWDAENDQWASKGIINYDYNQSLEPVEASVKEGDYEAAQEELLAYYRKRKDTIMPEVPPRDKERADLFVDRVYFQGSYITTFTVTDNPEEISLDVTKQVQDRKRSFLLMARYKEPSVARFNSRHAGEHPPVIEATVNGEQMIIRPEADTFARAGRYIYNTSFGEREYIRVSDANNPGDIVDSDTSKGYITFDLSPLSDGDEVEEATLRLYGRTDSPSGEQKIMLALNTEFSLHAGNENSISWARINHAWFLYEGVEGLQAWRNPSGTNNHMWFFVTSIVRFPRYGQVVSEYVNTGDEYYAYNAVKRYLEYVRYQMFNRLDSGIRTSKLVEPTLHLLESNSMTPRAWRIILEHAYRMGDWFYNTPNWYPGHNYGASQIAGASKICYYFSEFHDVADWWERYHDRIKTYLTNLFMEDYSFVEANTGYMTNVLPHLNTYRRFARLRDVDVPEEVIDGFRGIARYTVDVTDPGGLLFPYGDTAAPRSVSNELLRGIAEDHDDSELLYITTDGEKGEKPERTSVYYPNSAIAVMRTEWANQDALGLFVNARNGGTHSHPNTLSLCAYAYGRQLIDDTYYASSDYKVDPNSIWVKQNTSAHNTVEINQQRQRFKGDSGGSLTANPMFDFFEGWTDATSGFRHSRSILLSKRSNFWIVSDYIEARSEPDEEHHYNQTWHMRPDSRLEIVDEDSKKVASNYDSGANMTIAPVDPHELKVSLEDGWWVMEPNTYVSYVKEVSGDGTFDTVLYPTSEGRPTEVKTDRIEMDVSTSTATAIELKVKEGDSKLTAVYYLSHESEHNTRDFGDYSFDGRMAYIENGEDDLPEALSLKGGSALRDHRLDLELVQAEETIADIGIEWESETVRLASSEAESAEGLRIYAPEPVNLVELNGDKASFERDGDFIVLQGKPSFLRLKYRV